MEDIDRYLTMLDKEYLDYIVGLIVQTYGACRYIEAVDEVLDGHPPKSTEEVAQIEEYLR